MNVHAIEVLLHYSHRCSDYHMSSFLTMEAATSDAIMALKANDLLEANPQRAGINLNRSGPYVPAYRITERGRVFIQAMRDLPLPVNKWVMP